MTEEPRLPVLIGSGQLRANRERDPGRAREPLELLAEAAGLAARDTGIGPDDGGLLRRVDDVSAVCTASWTYDDLASVVGRRVGASPRTCTDAPMGGQWPVRLLDAAAARIAAGESTLALVVGGEAQASVSAFGKAGIDPARDLGWSTAPGGPPRFDPADLGTERMHLAGLVLPARNYPLFENRLQHDLGLSPEENLRWSAELYAAFSRVAAEQPAAWSPEPRTVDDLATVGPGNRMISEPYPLGLNAMPHVDQAAAVLLTSQAEARRLGVPDERMVHVRGGAACDDSADLLDRVAYGSSAALGAVLDASLSAAGVSAAELDLVDVYSCFPVVPKLAALHLGLPRDPIRPNSVLTVTGGHSGFGGPLNSYSLHALATMFGRLRDGPAANVGLVHANGGYLTYQHAVVLATTPHPDGYVGRPEPVTAPRDGAPPAADPRELLTDGESVELVVETATVEHGRDGEPSQAFVIGRTPNGVRTAAATRPGDRDSAAALSLFPAADGRRSQVGRAVRLACRDGVPVIEPDQAEENVGSG